MIKWFANYIQQLFWPDDYFQKSNSGPADSCSGDMAQAAATADGICKQIGVIITVSSGGGWSYSQWRRWMDRRKNPKPYLKVFKCNGDHVAAKAQCQGEAVHVLAVSLGASSQTQPKIFSMVRISPSTLARSIAASATLAGNCRVIIVSKADCTGQSVSASAEMRITIQPKFPPKIRKPSQATPKNPLAWLPAIPQKQIEQPDLAEVLMLDEF